MKEEPSTEEARLSAKALLRRLLRAFEAGEDVDFSVGEPAAWIKAIDRLLVGGHLDAARAALARLRAIEPELGWSASVLELIDLLPETPEDGPRFADDRDAEVQVVPRSGAQTVIFAFCGRRHRFGMPLWLTQRWMSRLNASVVYLRDFGDTHYLAGLRALGSRDRTIGSLNAIAEQLGAGRVLCMGNSSGGFAALDYGLALGAEKVLSFGGSMNLEPEFNAFLNRAEAARVLRRRLPHARLDLREVYAAAPRRPLATLVYGDQCWDDRLHGEHMAGLPGVELAPVEGYAGHGSLPELIRRGGFVRLMDDFVAPAPAPGASKGAAA